MAVTHKTKENRKK